MLALLVVLLQCVNGLVDYLRTRKIVSAVQAAAIKEGNDNALRIIEDARVARDGAFNSYDAGSVRADDPDFRDSER